MFFLYQKSRSAVRRSNVNVVVVVVNRGATSVVYRCLSRDTGQAWAVKVITKRVSMAFSRPCVFSLYSLRLSPYRVGDGSIMTRPDPTRPNTTRAGVHELVDPIGADVLDNHQYSLVVDTESEK